MKKRKSFKEQINEINDYLKFDDSFFLENKKYFEKKFKSRYFWLLLKNHNPLTWEDIKKLITIYLNFGRGSTKEKFHFKYGKEEGTRKWNDYCLKQSISNTFEYKKEKYGMNENDFKKYNESRAVTLNNLIKRHGEKIGKEKWDVYRKKQAFTNTEEYLGAKRYKEANRKKSHSLDVYIERYNGDVEKAKNKLLSFYENISTKHYSKISQELFWKIYYEILNDKEKEKCYFAELNKEYIIMHKKKVHMFDFVCSSLKLCVEFYGDHYHGNPKFYKPGDTLNGRGCTSIFCKEKWESDEEKINMMKIERNYDTIVIWEYDWKENPSTILEKIEGLINERRSILFR